MTERAHTEDRKVCIGVIAGPHGVKGQVRLKSFTAEPADVAAYGPVTDASGARAYTLEIVGTARNLLVARIEGVTDRNAAEALRGVELHVDRDRLPEAEADEFYHADLIGLPVRTVDGDAFGTVLALYNYGAGDVIEVRCVDGDVELLPFNKDVVPEIDLENGFLVVAPPAETYARPEDADAEMGADARRAGS
ncbi:MAG: ribosome maturation factor RimM [Gammaproteobacteria bacterium]|jgi:16S rRNA processing protein RimM